MVLAAGSPGLPAGFAVPAVGVLAAAGPVLYFAGARAGSITTSTPILRRLGFVSYRRERSYRLPWG